MSVLTAVVEGKWNYECVWTATSANDLHHAVSIGLINEMHSVVASEWCEIFARMHIYATTAFFNNVQEPQNPTLHRRVLPQMNMLLEFADKSILVVTDREADGILKAFWDHGWSDQSTGYYPRFLCLNMTEKESPVEPRALQACRLFNGDTDVFPDSPQHRQGLRSIIANPKVRENVNHTDSTLCTP